MWSNRILTLLTLVKIGYSQQKNILESVVPINYQLDLKLEDNFLSVKNFTGSVTILFNLNKNLTTFYLHGKNLIIEEDAELKIGEKTFNITATNPDEDDIITITSTEELTEGSNYTLSLPYTGVLLETSLKGFYLSSYFDSEDNTTKYLAVTNFKGGNAKRAFPCFDDPRFQATFNISITHPENYSAISNTLPVNNDTRQTIFKQTPYISPDMVAFVVSELTCSDYYFGKICLRPGTGSFADTVVRKVLETMTNSTNNSYSNLGIDRLTQVAVPDFDTESKESDWGLITYKESDFLWYDNESSVYDKHKILTTVTYNLVYQWFARSADKFVRQGFATYFKYFIKVDDDGGWKFDYQFLLEELQTGLLIDSLNTTFPLVSDPLNPDASRNKFQDVSSNKGASLFKMISSFSGNKMINEWLTNFVEVSKTSLGRTDALWSSYDKLNKSDNFLANTSLSTIMENWITKSGYPLVKVNLNENNITITQEPFSLDGTSETTKWYIPVIYLVAQFADNGSEYQTAAQKWLTPEQDLVINVTLKENDWLAVNYNQWGFFRVEYDDKLLSKLSKVINSSSLIDFVKFQLIDDEFNLARAGKKNYKDVLQFVTFLKDDTTYYNWYSALKNFNFLLQRTVNATVKNALTNYVKDLMSNFITITSLKNEQKYDNLVLEQILAQTWACRLGDSACVTLAKAKFDSYVAGNTDRVNPNLRKIIYCTGLRHSDNASKDFDFLWKKYLNSTIPTEKITILESLGCVNDTTLRKQYLEKVLTLDIKIQNTKYVFESVSFNNEEGISEVLNFLHEKASDMNNRFSENPQILSNALLNIMDLGKTKEHMYQWSNLTLFDHFDESIREVLGIAKNRTATNLKVTESLENTLKEYFALDDNNNDDNNDGNDDNDDDDNNSGVMTSHQALSIVFLLVGYHIFL